MDLVLDIDVQGARQLKERIPGAVSIFILAPSRQILEERLRARSQDSEPVIERRLRDAAEEIRNYSQYDYVLVNREVEASVETLVAIVKATRSRRDRMEEQIRPILETFNRCLRPNFRHTAAEHHSGRSGSQRLPLHHRGGQARPPVAERRAQLPAHHLEEAHRRRHGRSAPRTGAV